MVYDETRCSLVKCAAVRVFHFETSTTVANFASTAPALDSFLLILRVLMLVVNEHCSLLLSEVVLRGEVRVLLLLLLLSDDFVEGLSDVVLSKEVSLLFW